MIYLQMTRPPSYLSLITIIMLALTSYAVDLGSMCPSTCALPACVCPSTAAPGSLQTADTPQLIVLYTDETVNEEMFARIVDLTTNHQNKNGCDIPITWYIRSKMSDASMIRNAYNRYFEIGISAASEGGEIEQQIRGAKQWLMDSANIPGGAVSGFRAPKWSNGVGSRSTLAKLGFQYDNSIEENGPDPRSRIWPYSMDVGIAQNCTGEDIMCDARERHPGIMEIPVWGLRDRHDNLHRVSRTSSPGDDLYSNPDWISVLQFNFAAAFYGNRAPLSIPLSADFLLNNDANMQAMGEFLKKILQFEDVWVVTNSQLVQFMKEPLDKRRVHDILQCGNGAPAAGDKPYEQCELPAGGCARGTFDYRQCSCACDTNFCSDYNGRCTVAAAVSETNQVLTCPAPEAPPATAEPTAAGVRLSVWLIILFVILGIFALFGLYRGLMIGRRRAAMMNNDP